MNREGTFRKGNKVNLGRKQSPEEIQKRLESRLRRIDEIGYTEAELNKGKKISQIKTGSHHTLETKNKISISRTGIKPNLTPEGRERMRQSALDNKYQMLRKSSSLPRSEEAKRKISIKNIVNMKIKWQDDAYVAMQMKARKCSPNKPEQKLTTLIETNQLPFRYVGDGQFILGGKCPDFLNTNGKKQLIELFGTYWHGILDIGNRTEYFRQYGFSTLIIWEDELKDEDKLLKKIKRFNSSKGVINDSSSR